MLDFYYQTGEIAADGSGITDFIKDSAVQLIGTGLAAFFALKLYYKQVKTEREKDKQQGLERDFNNLKYFHFLISDSIVVIDRIIIGVLTLNGDLRYNFVKIPSLSISRPFDNLKRISQSINQSDVFHSFQNLLHEKKFTDDSKSISEMFATIDVVNDNLRLMYVDYKRFNKGTRDFYNAMMGKLKQQNDLIAVFSIENSQLSLGKKLLEIRVRYNSLFNTDPTNWLQLFQERNLEIFKAYNDDDFKNFNQIKDINSLSSELAQLIVNVYALRVSFAATLLELARDFRNYNHKLRREFSDLDSFINCPKNFIQQIEHSKWQHLKEQIYSSLKIW